MTLHRLIYASRAMDVERPELDAILAACERNNPARHLTGMLLFNADHFVQLLEGPRGTLTERFVAIAQDPRHRDVEIMSFGAVETRLFADWSMNYVGHYGDLSRILKRYKAGPVFDPFGMAPKAVEQMCWEFASLPVTTPELAAES